MRPIALSSIVASFALAACQQSAPSPENDASPATAPTAATTAPSNATPAPAPTTAAAIPEQFRGVWDNAGGNCNPASDLRLEIGAVSIEFYESLGAVTGVTIESPSSIVVDLAMEGEGERWERTNRYVLSDDGATLTPSEVGAPPAAAIPRKRCAQ
jgi:hypothetical protein